MSKKYTPSKETYFNRQGNTLTLTDWEVYKSNNPQEEFTCETCWDLHDSMLARQKPAKDSLAIIKLLLKDANINYKQTTDGLEITSDLTGQDVLVLDIECDDLLLQLEAAGAKVLYITSNVNYYKKAPDLYFKMYPQDYDAEDYPAIDKRNLFEGKNIIVKYINFFKYRQGIYKTKLYSILRSTGMKFDKTLMNPPFDGNLHLSILDTTLKTVRAINPEAEIVSVQPAYWIEDTLAKYKKGTEYKKYEKSIINKISKLQLIDPDTASYKFGIGLNCDLGIYTFNSTTTELKLFTIDVHALINKIIKNLKKSIKDVIEQNKINGIRVELHEMLLAATGEKGGQSVSAKTNMVSMVNLRSNAVFKDGYDTNGNYWTEDGRAKNGSSKTIGATFPYSILFNSLEEANNFVESCRTNFYKNLIHLVKFNAHTPFSFLPYMEDYSHIWTNEDYCKHFKLSKEEAEFMCRKVEDYRVKDFINYAKLDEE